MAGNPSDWEPVRTVRVPDSLWFPARDKARRSGTDISSLIRAWLAVYTSRDDIK